MKTKLWIGIFWLLTLSTYAQQKYEREYRVKEGQVPQRAVEFIQKCNFKKKVKWYVEESQDGKTFEAKSRKNGNKFSIEFDTKGNVLDVEKKVRFSKLPEKIQQQLTKTLSKRFRKYKIKKVQIQWQTDHDFYIELIHGRGEDEINEFYEIVVKGKRTTSYELYELLLTKEGTIVKELKFAPENLDNLEF